MAVTSPYDSITPESIKTEMLAELKAKGFYIDTREGSYTNTLVSTAAYQIFKLYQQFPKQLSMVFPDENAGEYIDFLYWKRGDFHSRGNGSICPRNRFAVFDHRGCEDHRQNRTGKGGSRGNWHRIQPSARFYYLYVCECCRSNERK